MMVLVLASARTATAQTITEFPSPFTLWAGSIAGSDGALWFPGANKIGRITTAGVVTEFSIPVPAPFFVYTNIAAGPDGALWFGLVNVTRGWPVSRGIGRMTTTGEFSEFWLPPGDASINGGITAGPDGALWFTEGTAGKIGRITTAGTINEYPLPTPNSSLSGITAGPDGALWFIEGLSPKIGRITTAGEFSEFALPTPNSHLQGITVGSDGALWFTELNTKQGYRIGRFGQSDEDVTADVPTFHWERWILYLEIATSLAIIIAGGLKRLSSA
jgi:virginiamycin B lyase